MTVISVGVNLASIVRVLGVLGLAHAATKCDHQPWKTDPTLSGSPIMLPAETWPRVEFFVAPPFPRHV